MKKELAKLIPIAEAISKNFGRNCETVIHDFSRPENSIVYIAGELTGRTVGGSLPEPISLQLRLYGDNVSDMHGFYRKMKNGKILKCSNVFIRDDNKKVIGALSINYDVTDFVQLNKLAKEWLPEKNNNSEGAVRYNNANITDVLGQIISETLEKTGKSIHLLQKEDKLKIVEELDERGVFLIKGSIDEVAKSIGVSRYTIYNYLEEVRALKL
jgi:predicted transcriptional regulator YheO